MYKNQSTFRKNCHTESEVSTLVPHTLFTPSYLNHVAIYSCHSTNPLGPCHFPHRQYFPDINQYGCFPVSWLFLCCFFSFFPPPQSHRVHQLSLWTVTAVKHFSCHYITEAHVLLGRRRTLVFLESRRDLPHCRRCWSSLLLIDCNEI